MTATEITPQTPPDTGEKKALNLLRIIRDHAVFVEVEDMDCVVGRVDAPRLRAEMKRYGGPTSDAASVLSDLHAPLAWLYQRFGMSYQVRNDGLCLVFFRRDDYLAFADTPKALPDVSEDPPDDPPAPPAIVVREPKQTARKPTPEPDRPLDSDAVIDAALSVFGLSYHDVVIEKKRSGQPREALARSVIVYVLRYGCGLSFPNISKKLRYASSGAIVTSLQRFEDRMSSGATVGMHTGRQISIRDVVRQVNHTARSITDEMVGAA